jgi:hypothetical protein
VDDDMKQLLQYVKLDALGSTPKEKLSIVNKINTVLVKVRAIESALNSSDSSKLITKTFKLQELLQALIYLV